MGDIVRIFNIEITIIISNANLTTYKIKDNSTTVTKI